MKEEKMKERIKEETKKGRKTDVYKVIAMKLLDMKTIE